MTDYKVEIIKKGKETLEKLLLLLTEDSILFENREEKKKTFQIENISLILKTAEKLAPEEGLENKEVFINTEKYLEFKDKLDELRNFSKSQYLASNAHFIYLFALFDQFILEVAKLSLENQPEVLETYKDYCLKYYKKNDDQELLDRLTSDSKLINYFPNLRHSRPLSVITKILGINFKEEEYIDHYFNFIEMKERRNLLVHRGEISDQEYFKTIKNYLSKYSQKKLNDFLIKLEENKNKTLNIEPDYFLNTIKTFYFLVCIIVNSAIPKKNLGTKKIILFTDSFNDLLNYSLENKTGLYLINCPLELFSLYKSKYLANDLSKMNDVDKVNWILCNERAKDMINYALEKTESLKDFEITNLEEQKAINFRSYDNQNKELLIAIEDELIKEMINAYLEKSYQKYCEKIFLFAKREKMFLKDIESNWYMHKSFSKDLEFKKFYASYKKKNNHEAKEVKVKMPSNLKRKPK